MSESLAAGYLQFLAGGGEMGRLIGEKDWGTTPVGDISQWPIALRIPLGILLHSKFPMFLFWGEELTCFYNDAYRPSLGREGKHPDILGMRGRDAWPEIWDTIYPLIRQVMSGGEATWSENQLIPIYRNGRLEDVYWTFSYSPVLNETGKIEGVFVTCTETTESVQLYEKLIDSDMRLRDILQEAPLATAIFNGPDFTIEIANDKALQLWGKDRSVIGKKLLEGMPELRDQPFIDLLRKVVATGETYYGNESLVYVMIGDELKPIYVTFIYKALYDHSGKIYGVITMGYDVTEEVEKRNSTEYSIQQFSNLISQSPAAMSILKGPKYIITIANETMINMWGKGPDVIGKPMLEVTPEIVEQGYGDLLKKVYETGEPHHEYESKIRMYRNGQWEDAYFTFVYQPYREEGGRITGVAVLAHEVTPKALATKKTIENEQRFRDTVMQAPVGITIFRGRDFVVEMANETYLQIVDVPEHELVGRPLFHSLPEVKEIVQPLLTGVMDTGEAFHAKEFRVTLNRYGKSENVYFNFVYQPLRERDGTISGIIVVASEVTQQVEARHALAESEREFRNMVMQSPIAMTIFRGEDFIIEMPNETMLRSIWHKEEEEVLGRKALEVFPELKAQKYPELLRQVMLTGHTHEEIESVAYVQGNEGMKKFYLDYQYAPLFDPYGKVDGVFITVYDVTEKVEARQFLNDAAERLILATEGTKLATWDLNLRTKEVIYSPRLAEIFGIQHGAKFNHADLRNYIHPEDRAAIVEKAYIEALKTGVYFYEARIIRPDESIHWIRTQGKVIFDEEGQPVRMLGTAMDITDERRSLQLIEENQQRFRLLADAVPQFVWTTNAEGYCIYVNQALYDYTGLPEGYLFGDNWWDIIHPDDKETSILRWKKAIRSGEPYTVEHRFRRYDGEYSWQLSRAMPQHNENGAIREWVGTSTDIDDMKKQEQKRDDFIKMASHELKTPVTSIKGYIQLLQKKHADDSDPFLKTSLSTIDRQMSKLTKLISELLDMTRIETGGLLLKRENFPLADLAREVVADMQATTRTHQLELEINYSPLVNADHDRIGQVLNNLITNAIKYSPLSAQVIIGINKAEGGVLISVKDFGIGIAAEEHPRIFERFYRVEGKDEKTFPGFGIGLFIVNEIILNHQGRVWVESEKERGADFYVFLPVADEE